MKQIELYVPITDNDGHSIGREHWRTLERVIRFRFSGFTAYRANGQWIKDQLNDCEIVHHDKIVVYRILCEGSDEDLATIRDLAEHVKRHWRQESVLFTVADIEATFT